VGDCVELGDGVRVSAVKVHRNRIKLVRVEFPVMSDDDNESAG
jgi:hypothetical protein